MQIFIEQAFINDYFIEYDENNLSDGKKMLNRIFTEYTELEVFIDCNNSDDIIDLSKQNRTLSQIFIHNPNAKPIGAFKDYFSSEIINLNQVIILLKHKYEWTDSLSKRGFILFFYDNYEEVIEKIINDLHFRIDLSGTNNPQFNVWTEFSRYKFLPFNSVVIIDSYILGDKSNQKINKNLVPFLQNLLEDKNKSNISLTILTYNLGQDKNSSTNFFKAEKEKAKRKIQLLNSKFALYKVDFSIVKMPKDFLSDFEFHDRLVYTNYSILEVGKGFNLSKNFEKSGHRSNSQILSETIFDKYTYNRIKNHLKMMSEYLIKLKNFETYDLKYYPEEINNTLLN